MDKKHTSLSAQAAQLQRSIQSREQRRIAEKAQRYEAAEAAGEYGAYEGPPVKRAALGGGAGHSAALVKLSEISALVNRPAEVFRCELCNASFPSQAQHQQHLAGPVHRKALDKLSEQQLTAQRRAVYQDMTESALGAAAWASAHGSGGAGGGASGRQQAFVHGGGAAGGGGISGAGGYTNHTGPASGAAGGAAGATGRGGPGGRAGGRWPGGGGRNAGHAGRAGTSDHPPLPRHGIMSHEEMVAAATRTDEPLTIGGWAPPIITLPAPKPSPPEKPQPAKQPTAKGTPQQNQNRQAAHPKPEDTLRNDKQMSRSDEQEWHPSLSPTAAPVARSIRGEGLLGLVYGSDDEDEGNDDTVAQKRCSLSGGRKHSEEEEGQRGAPGGPAQGSMVEAVARGGDDDDHSSDDDDQDDDDGDVGDHEEARVGRFTGSFF
ncbi:hypothetical protein VaNZ11_009834 [Volvox africanus]|uniref:C2H2-type domain-containing protein n=1 Tax=Volvox africanus TaxID=51714 RepID=A0ABQ5S8A1_9CHLO|nr:hypothetical protein VaNZ11_009834 [Volvox africanus]